MKMEENEKLEDFILKFDHVLCQLKTSSAEIKEEDTICTLLLALPKQYETVVTVLENLPTENLSLDFVKAKLRTEAEKKKEISGSQATAFISHKPQACYNCGEYEHFKKNCKKLDQSQTNRKSYDENRGGKFHRGRMNREGANQDGIFRGDKNQQKSKRWKFQSLT